MHNVLREDEDEDSSISSDEVKEEEMKDEKESSFDVEEISLEELQK